MPIRILQVVPAMNCGGMETFIMNVYRNIDRNQVQFDFLYHYQDQCYYDDEILSLGGKIYRLSVRNDNNFIKYFRDLDEFFRTHKEYNIIHGHFSGFGIFYNHYAKKHGVMCRIGHSHSDKYEMGIIGQIDHLMSKPFRHGLTQRFACSQAAGKFLFGKYPFSVCANGIDVDAMRFCEQTRAKKRLEYGFEPKDIILGNVARFAPVKNQAFLLDVLAELRSKDPRYKLVLVGDGALKVSIETRAETLGIRDAVCFLGQQRAVVDCLDMFDLFVMPSLVEGIPLSLMEAQANGLRCVVSDKVNPDVDVTGNVHLLPLVQRIWCEYLETADLQRDMNAYKDVVKAGYDNKNTAKLLQDFYIDMDQKQGLKKAP